MNIYTGCPIKRPLVPLFVVLDVFFWDTVYIYICTQNETYCGVISMSNHINNASYISLVKGLVALDRMEGNMMLIEYCILKRKV